MPAFFSKNKELFLNVGIGSLSIVLLVLLFALFSRVIYPRVITERSELETYLVSNVIQVEVLNGCGVSGIATTFTNALRDSGFDVVASGNYDSFEVEESIVIHRGGDIKHARQVAEVLGIPSENVIHETSPYYYLDATVIIGADYETLQR
ncbi:MAG: LytR C-terminal domain-containing protein [Cyclonatronaceae bacterium]